MVVAQICFTSHGIQTAQRIAEGESGYRIWVKKKDFCEADDLSPEVIPLTGSLREWTGQRFKDSDALIFVGATGIAVRSIAPFLQSKKTDPAVLAVDERGTFVISLISGHIGGANELAQHVAEKIGAVPVITTATDRSGLWAVDVFARKNGLAISDMRLAKYVSAALLDRQKVYFGSEFPMEGKCPPELTGLDETEYPPGQTNGRHPGLTVWVGIHTLPALSDNHQERKTRAEAVSPSADCATQDRVLLLVPRIVTLGIGCRRGKDPEELCSFVRTFLEEHRISAKAVRQICSIDLKKEEPGIIAAARRLDVPFRTFPADELRQCPGTFTASDFVTRTVGVDNVCERSALLGAIRAAEEPGDRENENQARLIVRKKAQDGMTMAAAVSPWHGVF